MQAALGPRLSDPHCAIAMAGVAKVGIVVPVARCVERADSKACNCCQSLGAGVDNSRRNKPPVLPVSRSYHAPDRACHDPLPPAARRAAAAWCAEVGTARPISHRGVQVDTPSSSILVAHEPKSIVVIPAGMRPVADLSQIASLHIC